MLRGEQPFSSDLDNLAQNLSHCWVDLLKFHRGYLNDSMWHWGWLFLEHKGRKLAKWYWTCYNITSLTASINITSMFIVSGLVYTINRVTYQRKTVILYRSWTWHGGLFVLVALGWSCVKLKKLITYEESYLSVKVSCLMLKQAVKETVTLKRYNHILRSKFDSPCNIPPAYTKIMGAHQTIKLPFCLILGSASWLIKYLFNILLQSYLE